MSFKQWLIESERTGNYVAIKSEDLSDFFTKIGVKEPVSGVSPPMSDYHCTLIYSENTSKDTNYVREIIKNHFQDSFTAFVAGAECFDAIPEDGERNSSKSCIVLKLNCEPLVKIHEFLRDVIGLKHSYDVYRPHITLRYNMNVEEAHSIRDEINRTISNWQITLNNIYSQTINKDYV